MKPSELTLQDARAKPVALTWTQQASRDMDAGMMLGRLNPDGTHADYRYWSGAEVSPSAPGEPEQVSRMKTQARAEQQRALGRSFVPAENMVSAVIDNVTAHVGGSETSWNITGGTEALVAEANAVLNAAHAGRNLHDLMQEFTRSLAREGCAAIRPRIPPAAAPGRNFRSTDMVEIARRWLRIEIPAHETVFVGEDETTLTPYSVFTYTVNGADAAEVSFIDDQGQTVIRQLGPTPVEDTVLNLGGRVPMIMAKGRPVVTFGMIRNQMSANSTVTSASKNTEFAGWVERWMHNIEAATDSNGRPIPIITGPSSVIATRSAMYDEYDETGTLTARKPIGAGSYTRFEPVSAAPLEAALYMSRYNIYAEARQLHYLMAADATASGESRKTAMAAFGKSLSGIRSDYTKAFRELLELILAMTSALAGQPGKFESLHIEPALTDSLTEPTAEARQADRDDVAAGIISLQTARSRQGITDSDAEQAQIDAEKPATPITTVITAPATKPPVTTP